MIAFPLDRRPRRQSDVWVRRAEGENALVRPGGGRVHLLNDTALAIWDLCDGENRPDEMIAAICELCRAESDVIAKDVQRILDEFEQEGLITWVN
jgi:hypothetical protein